jgi:acyl carrier protein
MDLFTKVQQIISVTLKVSADKITGDTSDKNFVAWDSLAHVNLMMGLEQTFDLFMDVEDFAKLTSVPAILAYLKERGAT